MADDVTITVHVRDLTGPGFRSVTHNLNQLQRQANQMGGSLRIVGGQLNQVAGAAQNAGQNLGGGMGLRGQAIAAGVALGTTLLPTIGALAPMLTGLTVVAGGGALALDDLKKKAKELKKPFEEWQKVANKAVAPHTEKAVKSLKSAMEGLNPVIKVGADTFGRITEKAARFVDSPAFQSAFAKNAEMGSKWVEQFGSSIGTFTQEFLEFGAKSQPALDAWQDLLGGFLDSGLPGMFDGLEQGISGSSELLSGLASFINDGLLPTLGKVAGAFTEAFGPLLGEMLEAAGAGLNFLGSGFEVVMELLEPFTGIIADAFRAMNDIAAIGLEVMGELASVVGGSLFEALMSVVGIDTSQLGNGFRGLSDWVKENEGQIRSAFVSIAQGVVDMVMLGVNALPLLVAGFQMTTSGVLTALDGIISGAAKAFQWVPGIGDSLKHANEQFDEFASGFRRSLGTAQDKATEFAAVATEKLSQGKLKLNISNWESQIKTAKEQMKSVPPEKRAALKARISDLQAKVRQARGELASLRDRYVNVNVHYSYTGGKRSDGATFLGPSGRYAEGGPITGGSGTKDDVPILAMGGEFMVNKRSTQKHRALLEAINEDRLPRFAKGGSVSKSEREARNAARGDLTLSHFGTMAGYKNSEIIGQLARADSLGSLVDSLNRWRSTIMKGTHGGQERSLLKALDSSGRKLLSWEKQLTSVSKSLESAKTKLNDLKSAASQLTDSVKSGILSGANITRAAGAEDSRVTINTILSQMQGSAANAGEFDRALKELKKRGLSSALLQQVAEAGVEGGGLETAQALLGASSGQLKLLGSLQSQITASAGSAGKTTSDAVFGAQIKAQQAYVTVLTKSQDKLTKSMESLARSIEKMIERAFGKAAGGIVGAAASGGIRSNLTWVGEQGPELLDLPVGSRVWSNPDSRRMQKQAWASMLNEPRRAAARPAGAASPAGGERPIVLNVSLGGREFGQIWVDVGRKEVSTRGGLTATLGS